MSVDAGPFSIARASANWTSVIAPSVALIGKRTQTKETPLVVRMARAATVTGRVLDSKAKVPIAGAFVRANLRGMRQNDAWWGAVSDAKGNFTLHVAPGSYSLTASHPAYEMRPVDINPTSGQTVNKEVVLTPLSRVTGAVVDDERKPIAAAVIATQDVRDDFPMRMTRDGSVVSGPDGRFSMRVRSESELKLRAVKKGFPPATGEAL